MGSVGKTDPNLKRSCLGAIKGTYIELHLFPGFVFFRIKLENNCKPQRGKFRYEIHLWKKTSNKDGHRWPRFTPSFWSEKSSKKPTFWR